MARINEVVNRIIMQAKSEGFDVAIADAERLAKAQGNLGKSSEALAQTTDTSVKKQLSALKPFEMQERRLNQVARAQFEYDEVKRKSDRALAQFPELQGRYNTVMAEQTTRLNTAKEAAERNAAAQLKMQQSMVIPDRVPTMIEAVKDSYRRTREELVPLFGIGQQYKRQIDEVRTALAANQISQTQATAAMQRYRAATHEQVDALKKVDAATGKYINGTGLARHELINLSRQAQDVGVSLVSGQGLFTVLTQQGSQIADIFISTGATMASFWGQVKAGAALVLKPIVAIPTALLTIGATAVAAAMGFSSGQKDIERSLLGIGKASGATRDDINRIAKESASAFGFSVNEAAEFASALAVTGRIGVEEIGKVVAIGKDVARIYGVDAADAAKMLAKAYADPAKGAEELNQRLGSFNAATLETIKNLQVQNKMQEAQSLLTTGIAKGVDGVSATVSRSTTEWEAFSNSISNAWRAFGEGLAQKMGMVQDSPVNVINNQLKETERLIEEIKQSMDFRSGATDMPGVGISAAPVDKAALEAAETNLRNMQEQAAMLKQHMAQVALDAKRTAESLANQKMVDTAFPLGKQLRDAEVLAEGLNQRLKDIAASGGEGSPLLKNMNRSLKDVEMAARAAASAVKDLQEKVAQEDRRIGQREQVRQQFEGTGIGADVGIQLKLMQDQLGVAQAVTGQEKMHAQEIATTNQLLMEGKTIQEATAVAAMQRATTQAQINAQSRMATMQLQNQLQVSMAVGGAARMEAQERATTQNLIEQGVSPLQAAAQAAIERANTQAEINSKAEEMLSVLRDQLAVASAISAKDRIRAQSEVTYNKLVRDGVASNIALAVAEQEAENAQAAINSQAERTLATLNGQLAIAHARGGQDKMAATAAARYNDLVMEGVDAQLAGKIAAAERAAQQEKINEAVGKQTIAMNESTEMIYAQMNGTEIATAAQQAYNRAIREGADAQVAAGLAAATRLNMEAKEAKKLADEYDKLYEKNMKGGPRGGGGGSAFAPSVMTGRYTFGTFTRELSPGDTLPGMGRTGAYQQEESSYGKGGYDIVRPRMGYTHIGFSDVTEGVMDWGETRANQQGLEFIADEALKAGTALADLPDRILQVSATMEDKAGAITNILDLLPENQQAGHIQKLLERVKQEPVTLAREGLIQDLNDKLESLQESTDDLNDSMKDILSPLYGTDPRTTKIGFRSDTGVFNPERYLTEREMGGRKPTPTPVTVPVVPSNDNRGPNPGWGQPTTGTVTTPGVTTNTFTVNISMATGDKQGARETGFQVQQALQRSVGARVS